jgi:MoaA/NifB/PqqE/SkfB family radical SAM enzyme
MPIPQIKLKNVIWEITNYCNKNCKFCGSKHIINNSIEEIKVAPYHFDIAQQLSDMQVDTVTFSGGEPGTFSSKLIARIQDTIMSNKVSKTRVVSNGLIFKNWNKSILEKLEAIGISINSPADIEVFTSNNNAQYYLDKTTIITNFGTHNIFSFLNIYNSIKNTDPNFKCWQIQLTMGNEFQLTDEGISYLLDRIEEIRSTDSTLQIILADNLLPENPCSACFTSCGITYDFFVVPCLSERSFLPEIRKLGDLTKITLENIWKNSCNEMRFGCNNKCCKDFINYPTIKKFNNFFKFKKEVFDSKKDYYEWNKPTQPNVYIYGAFKPGLIAYNIGLPKDFETGLIAYNVGLPDNS